MKAINKHYFYRADYNLSSFQKIGYLAYIFQRCCNFLKFWWIRRAHFRITPSAN